MVQNDGGRDIRERTKIERDETPGGIGRKSAEQTRPGPLAARPHRSGCTHLCLCCFCVHSPDATISRETSNELKSSKFQTPSSEEKAPSSKPQAPEKLKTSSKILAPGGRTCLCCRNEKRGIRAQSKGFAPI